MARLTRCFLTLLFITQTANAGLFSPGRDCLQSVLNGISERKIVSSEKDKLVAAAHYNDQIFKPIGAFSKGTLSREVEITIDEFGKYDGKLNTDLFKSWLKENPGEIKSNQTIGEYLHERYQPYKKIHPEVDLKLVASELPEDLKAIAIECGENIACNEKKIESLFVKKLSNSCIGKFKAEALRSMVTGIALTNAGYFISYSKHPENGYPFDLMANNLFWTPIVTELGCRNTLAQGDIGQKVNFGQISIQEKIKIGSKSYVQYMKISPLTNLSYVAFHTTKQLIDGDKKWKDVNVLDLSKQVASMTVWDAVYPVPRMVLVTDPLFMKGFPQLRNFYYNKIPFKVGAEGAYLMSDASFRVGLSFLNTELMNMWVKKSDQWWDTGFAPKNPKQKKSQ